MPLSLLLLFFFPIFRKVFVRLMGGEGDTYYRVLWLIPMGIIVAYGGVKLAGFLYERWGTWAGGIACAAVGAVIILGGRYVYASQYMSKAQNPYHLPQTVVDICDLIAPAEGKNVYGRYFRRIWSISSDSTIRISSFFMEGDGGAEVAVCGTGAYGDESSDDD